MRLSKVFIISGLIIVALLLGSCGNNKSAPGVDIQDLVSNKYDKLAQHLTAIGVKVYGTSRCSACLYQKEFFGDSWQYIDYIECSTSNGSGQTKICRDAKIKAYPTWRFLNGKEIKGAMPPERLAQEVKFTIEE